SQLDQRVSPGSLLEALVTNATLNEFDRAAARSVLTPPSQIARAQAGPGRVTFRIPESVRIDGPTPAPARPGMPGAVRVDTPRELGELILPEVTGGAKVAAWIAEQLRNPGPDPQPAIRDLLNFLHSLDQLAQ